jgi:uncharacterized ubiquitin-like protein YukD
MRNSIIIISLFLGICSSIFGQEIPINNKQTESCYQFYDPIQEAKNELKIREYLRSRGSRSTINGEMIRYYAIKPFLVKDRNVNDTILPMADLEKSLERVNRVFSEINIQFYYLEPVLVDDNRLFEFGERNEEVVASSRELSNTINLFVTNSIKIEDGATVNGYAYFPGGPERIFMSKDGVLNEPTFTHELGHFFRLYHTHGKSNFGTTDELVDGSNCTVAGDDICDTPADPNLLGKTNWACVYDEGLKDINGDLYNPDVQNIMSYSGLSCKTRFSKGQLERMNLASKALRTNLDGFESSSLIAAFTISQRRVDAGESVSFVSLSDNAVSVKWFFEKGSKTEGSELNEEVIYDQPGTFDVALKVTDALGNTDSVYYENAIKVLGKPDLAFGEIPLIISNRQATSSNDIITEDDKIFVDPSYFNFAGEFEGRVSGRLDFSNGQWYTFSNTGLIEYEAKFEREDLEFNNPGKGKYQFTFKLDFENELDEFNEENNTYTQELTIYGSEPEINITSAQLNENPNQDQLVTTIQVTDAESTAFDYRIITGNDNNAFSINESTGELLVNDPSQFDFEANSQFDLTIQAYTSEITADFDFIVSLNDINEVPSDILISSNSIAENSSVNSIIGQLSAIDQDSGDSFTFSLTAADENNDNGLFRINGNNLETDSQFNFEERSSYSVRIKVEDSGGLSFEKLVEVKVIDVNEAPEIATIISDVTKPEDSDEFILVKDFLSFFSDPDEGDLLSLASVSTNASNEVTFRVEGDDIYASVTKDWFGAGIILLIVKDQEGLSKNNSFQLIITPVNDPPSVSLGAEELLLEKNFVGEEEVSIYMQQPSNEFWLETVTYTTNPTTLDFIDFRIEDQKIIFTAKPDQLGQISNLEVIADDGQGVNNIGKATISISVEDFTGPSDIKISGNTINENSAAGSIIGELTATVPSDEETFEFILVSGDNSLDNEYFQIVNGELLVNSDLDFETKSSYTINVQVEDSDGNTYGKYLSIEVLDVNEAPTISRVIQNVSVIEDAERFTVITNLSDYFMDVDAGDELTFGYAHSEDENVTLSIDGHNLIAELAPDFFGVDYITLSVQDKGFLDANQQFELTVDAVNDPPVITLDRTDLQLVKNFEGQEVINISVQQPANESDESISLSLNPTQLDFINMELVGSQIRFTTKSDQIGSLDGIEVIANDGQSVNNTSSALFNIEVVEVVTISEIQLTSLSFDENLEIGTTVSLLEAIGGTSESIYNWSLSEGKGDDDNALFRINGSALESNSIFNFEEKSLAKIRLFVSDNAGNEYEKAFTLNIQNVNEAPSIINTISQKSISEDTPSFNLIENISGYFSDPDNSDQLNYTIQHLETQSIQLSIVNDNLLVSLAQDYFGRDQITLSATDQGGLSVSQVFSLEVLSVNDAPIVSLDRNSLILEKNFQGQEIINISVYQPENESDQEITFNIVPEFLEFIDLNISGTQLIVNAKENKTGTIEDLLIVVNDGQTINNLGEVRIAIDIEETDENSTFSFTNEPIKIVNEDEELVYSLHALVDNLPNSEIAYSLEGLDKSAFEIDQFTGDISFKNPLSWLSPFDSDKNNIYSILGIATYKGRTLYESILIVVMPSTDSNYAAEWVKRDFEIKGTKLDEVFGNQMVVSGDGKTMAFTVPGYNRANWNKVIIFRDISGEWVKIGEIFGETRDDTIGNYLTLSFDGNAIGWGLPGDDQKFYNSGRVDIYHYNGGVWTKKGESIFGDQHAMELGGGLSFSFTGDMVVVKGRLFKNSESISILKMFHFTSLGWKQLGNTFNSEGLLRGSIGNLRISANDRLLFFSRFLPADDPNYSNTKQIISTYELNSNIWVKARKDLSSGNGIYDITSDGSNLAITNVVNSTVPTFISFYHVKEGNWTKRSEDIILDNGISVGSLSFSADGNRISIGSPRGSFSLTGYVQTYQFINKWEELGQKILDFEEKSEFGQWHSLGLNGNYLIVSAHLADSEQINTGRIRFYQLNSLPELKEVKVNGELLEGSILEVNYQFSDDDNDIEKETKYQWYKVDQQTGVEEAIEGATSPRFELTKLEVGFHMRVHITPSDGKSFGETVISPMYGPVKGRQFITFSALSTKQYGDLPFQISASINSEMDIVYDSSNPSVIMIEGNTARIVGAGTTEITASQPGNENYLPAENVMQTLVVSPASLTATAIDQTKAYGEANPTLKISYSGFENGDDENAITEPSIATTADESSIVGDYDITLTSGSAENYTITTIDGKLTINKRPITVTADAKSKVYGEDDPALTYQITSGSLFNSDAITGALTRTTGEDVGDYAINQNTLTAGTNYDLTYTSDNLSISKATLTATAEDKSKTYGEANPTLAISYSGFVNGDDENDITELNILTTADETSIVGEYDITLTGGSATNYIITNTNGTLTINERPITVTADTKSKVYGEDDPALTYQITSGSLVNSDAITGVLSRTAGEDVNDYAINQNTLTAGSNYNLTYVSADLTISRAILTATAEDKSKTYGEANPTLTISYSGFVNGDDENAITEPTIATTADESSIVGDYDITLTGGSSDNYDLGILDGVLTVTKAPLSVTVQNETINKGDAIPEFSISYNGFVNSEDESVLTTKPTASTSANSTSDRGTYTIELSDGSSVNYTVNTVDGTLTVTGPVYSLPSTISFTDPVVLGGTETETIVLDNTGDGALNVTGIAVPSGYGINQTSLSVSKGSNTTLTLTFTPTAAQTYAGDIIITSNNGEDIITVTGEGQIVTGIDDDRLDLSEVKVYPNPSDKWLTIDLSDSPSTQANLMLLDPQGKTVWQNQEVSDREIRVNTSTFPSGFYLLIVQTDKGSVIKKVMVQH